MEYQKLDARWKNHRKRLALSEFPIELDMVSLKPKRILFFSGFDLNTKIGWRYSFVLNNMTFSFHGLIGADMKFLYFNDRDHVSNVEELGSYCIRKIPVIDWIGGVNAFAVYRVTDKIGITASVVLTTNLLGRGWYFRSLYDKESSESYYDDYFTVNYWLSGINIVLQVGVSFRF